MSDYYKPKKKSPIKKKLNPAQKQKRKEFIIVGAGLLAVGAANVTDYYHTKTEALTNQVETVQYNEKPIDIEDVRIKYLEKEAKEVTADDMLNDYARATSYKECKAVEELYEDQFLEVTGEVRKVYFDSIEGDFLTLSNDQPISEYADYMSIKCNVLGEDELAKLNELEAGDKITVTGYCKGSEGIAIGLYDCEIQQTK